MRNNYLGLSTSFSCRLYLAYHHVFIGVLCCSKQLAEKSLLLQGRESSRFGKWGNIAGQCPVTVFSKLYLYKPRQIMIFEIKRNILHLTQGDPQGYHNQLSRSFDCFEVRLEL